MEAPSEIDLHGNVPAQFLSTTLGTSLREAALAGNITSPLKVNHVFVAESGGRRYVVVAAAVKVFENDLERTESSLERF